jgi:hypothetical protein
MFNKNQNNTDNKSLNSVPVHTMQDDLASLKDPNLKEKFININKKEDSVVKNSQISEANSEKFKSSPFSGNNLDTGQYNAVQPSHEAPKPPQQTVNSQVNSLSPANTIKKVDDEREVFLKELAQKREIEKEEKQNSTVSGPKKSKVKINGVLFLVVSVVIIAAFLAGFYYFWVTRVNNANNENIVADNTENNNLSEDSVEIKGNEELLATESKFALSNPNILSINLDGGSEMIKKKLAEIAVDIKSEGISDSLEFVVTDSSNNPVSFVDFALASGIKLPAEILSYTEKNFSLYFYNDGNSVRLGLAASVKDPEKIKALLKNEETNLFTDLSPLYLENAALKIDKSKMVFASSNYAGNAIRYINLDSNMAISLDYTVNESKIVLGTSKNTLRIILDKLKAEVSR